MNVVPTTLTSLVLFLILLLPGFAYVIGKERNGTGQQATSFRETAAVVAASVSVEILVLGLFAIIRTAWPTGTPDVGALIREPGAYLRGIGPHPGHYALVALWGAGLLGVSVALAYLAALPGMRTVLGSYPHSSTISAWWLMLDTWEEGRDIQLGCVLDDGSYVEGYLGSFSTVADDQPDRDLVLSAPIKYRARGEDEPSVYGNWALVSVSASRIVALFVRYADKAAATSASVDSAPSEAVSTAEA
jgi:hypothetical protein